MGGPYEPRYRPIESYGLIGDLRTAALVGVDGSIDWFCPRRFDAPSLFASILDADRGGAFRIAPTSPVPSKQMYLPDTAVLVTRFYSDEGVGEVTDSMPLELEPCALLRRVDVVRGEVEFRVSCRPAFDYARAGHRVDVSGDRVARFTPDWRIQRRAARERAPAGRGPGRRMPFPPARGRERVVRVAAHRGRRAVDR